MSNTTRIYRNRSNPLKKFILPLLLLGLLAYLGVSTFITDDKDDGNSLVQQAEAMVIEADDTTNVDPVDNNATTQNAVPEEPAHPFVVLQNLESIPVPAQVDPEDQTPSSGEPDDSETASDNNEVPGEITVIIEPVIEPDPDVEGDSDAIEPESLTLIPTYSWVNAFSAESVFNGIPLPIGSIVTAYDPDGVLIGRATVTSAGEYGAMPIYMDDPSTITDEGAVEGDILKFKINGLTAVVLGPSEPVWTENGGVLVLNLASGTQLD
jgi:hypothetical protein